MNDLNHSRNRSLLRRGGFLLLFGGLLLASVTAQAQFTYTVTNNTVTITGYTGSVGVVVIPDTIIGLPVTKIGDDAFFIHTNLTSITIPKSVTTIGAEAFMGCDLTTVTIPNSVTNIAYHAFADCGRLTNITVDPLNSAYSSVEGVLFNESRTTLEEYPDGKLGHYTIPNSVISIGNDAFFDSSGLTGVTIPNSVTSIGNGAFSGCFGLAGIVIPNGVTSIGDWTFSTYDWFGGGIYGCPLTNITIPNSVTNIGAYAFAGCYKLTSVTTPNSVISIGDWAFGRCTSLTNITLGTGMTSIGNYTFGFCTNLGVYFQGNAPSLASTIVFGLDAGTTAYYLPGTTGWGSTFGGIPTALWSLPYPLVLNSSLGVRSNQFGFTVSWATNLSVVVEAATGLANPVWTPLATNALSGGWFYFNDPEWTKHPDRFYRIRSH